MFNSSILDVAAGLIFVYLLLALMCTTVNEWISQLLNSRAATLKEGIRRLLHAPPDGTYLIRSIDINVGALAKRLNKSDDKLTIAVGALAPEVKALNDAFVADLSAKADAAAPPSLAAALAGTLNALLVDPALSQKIDAGKVTPETKAALAKQPKGTELLRLNHSLLSEAYPDEINSLSDAFYNHPLIKALSKPGEHPAYVPAKTFVLAVSDILNKGRSVTSRSAEGVAQIRTAVDSLPDSDVKKSLQALITHGIESVDEVEKRLENWFETSMDRVSGWYKNKVQIWTVIVASVITIFANADTVQIARNLMLNPVLRDKIVEQAKNVNGPTVSQTATGQNAPTLTEEQKADLSSLTGWSDEFRLFHRLQACEEAARVNGQVDEQLEGGCRAQIRRPITANANARLAAAWNDDSFPGVGFNALIFPWLRIIVPSHLIGWIFTMIAASLGAPFWFDTLNKFMNVRAAGTAPNEKNQDKSKA